MRGLSDVANAGWAWLSHQAAIGPDSRRARGFGVFGKGSGICFPVTALYGERYIRIGTGVIIGPYASLSAGVMPGHVPENDPVITIGNDVLIGRGSGVVGHLSVSIGDGVFTGHHVYITDANHGYEDVTLAIGQQFAPPRPVSIGDGSWIGHGSIVLPGASVGKHVVIGAGSVVTGAIPDFSVAVGNPARIIRRYDASREEWVSVEPGQSAGEG